MMDEGQTGGDEMVVISESEYEELLFAKYFLQVGTISFFLWFFVWAFKNK